MPKADILGSSAAVSAACSSTLGAGILSATRIAALSAKEPLGAPEASRVILPPRWVGRVCGHFQELQAYAHHCPRARSAAWPRGVEVLGRRLEAVIVELRRLEPFVGAAGILGETRLNHRLQRVNRGLDSGKAALGAVDGADDRMDVRVDETGQDELATKIDDFGVAPISFSMSLSSPTARTVLPEKAIACLMERAESAV